MGLGWPLLGVQYVGVLNPPIVFPPVTCTHIAIGYPSSTGRTVAFFRMFPNVASPFGPILNIGNHAKWWVTWPVLPD